jgi:hypothetical protein
MALSSKTGSFTKNTGTGTQAVTGVGFTPKALLLWTSYATTTDVIVDGVSFGMGVTTGASESYATSFSSQDAVGTSNRSKRAASKALTVVQYGETTLAECDLTSFDGDGFTLDWTTNTGGAQIIHYLALGGDDITGKKVLTLTSPTLTGNKAYTGVGFKPETLLFLRPISTSALPFSAVTSDFGLSIIDKSGNSASLNVGGDDGVTVSPGVDSITYRVIKTDKATTRTNSLGGTVEASTWVSMDSDGFTLNYTTAGSADIFGCLALKGVRAKVGALPATASTTGVGFLPNTLLLASTQRANTSATQNCALDIGVSTGSTANQSAALTDPTFIDGGTSDPTAADSTGKCLSILSFSPHFFLTQLALSSFDADGFTLDGTTGNVVGYLALGTAPTVVTNAATDLTPTSGRLNGTVNPKGSSATYYFEYGLTTSYGSTTSTSNSSGSDDLAFNVNVTGLTNNTTYHYRAVVEATGVTVYGTDQEFTTPLGDVAVTFF